MACRMNAATPPTTDWMRVSVFELQDETISSICVWTNHCFGSKICLFPRQPPGRTTRNTEHMPEDTTKIILSIVAADFISQKNTGCKSRI